MSDSKYAVDVSSLADEEKRGALNYMARLAESAERYDDMAELMKQLVIFTDSKSVDLTDEERNLLSVAAKNLITSKRAACRTIAAIEQNPKYSKFESALATYKASIETKLTTDCQTIVDLLNNKVLCKPCQGEAKCFFEKMVADYYRYMAENAKGAELESVKSKAEAKKAEAKKPEEPGAEAEVPLEGEEERQAAREALKKKAAAAKSSSKKANPQALAAAEAKKAAEKAAKAKKKDKSSYDR